MCISGLNDMAGSEMKCIFLFMMVLHMSGIC